MTASQEQTGAQDASTVIPLHLIKPCAVLVEFGIRHLADRNGAQPSIPGLAELRRVLADGVAAASGRPPVMMAEPQQGRFLTTTEAARMAGISERRVRHHAATGQLIARKSGRDWLIDEDSARDYRKGVA